MKNTIYKYSHVPVMKQEILDLVMEYAKIKVFCDCTLGEGGHTEFLMNELKDWKFIGIEKDRIILEKAKHRLGNEVSYYNCGFSSLKPLDLGDIGVFLLDLGVSMYHFKESKRGFTFQNENEDLDMRLSSEVTLTASEILNTYRYEDIETMLVKNADITNPGFFAKKILDFRKKRKFNTVGDVLKCFDLKKRTAMHPLTRFFQALRIEVNNELDELNSFCNSITKISSSGSLFIFISYHSKEDTIVKNKIRELQVSGSIRVINKKVKKPAYQELSSNRSARSAKLRAFYYQ